MWSQTFKFYFTCIKESEGRRLKNIKFLSRCGFQATSLVVNVLWNVGYWSKLLLRYAIRIIDRNSRALGIITRLMVHRQLDIRFFLHTESIYLLLQSKIKPTYNTPIGAQQLHSQWIYNLLDDALFTLRHTPTSDKTHRTITSWYVKYES